MEQPLPTMAMIQIAVFRHASKIWHHQEEEIEQTMWPKHSEQSEAQALDLQAAFLHILILSFEHLKVFGIDIRI